MKKVLIITYYWPPAGGPGVQRWLKFVKYLRDFGVEPVVYIPENPSYPIIDESLNSEIPSGIKILKKKIFEPYALAEVFSKKDTQKISSGIIKKEESQSAIEKALLYIRGNFFIPDARKFWIKPSVDFLKNEIQNNNYDLIITSGPPHSLHLIGLQLKSELDIKWLADFRDPWTNIGYHSKLRLNKSSEKKHLDLESKVLTSADHILVTSWSTKNEFSGKTEKPISVITNGFDVEIQKDLLENSKFEISHIGSLLSGRDPQNLWQAISEIISENEEFKNQLKISLAGRVSEEVLHSIQEAELNDFLNIEGYVSHEEAIVLQRKAAILLLLEINAEETQGIIPGKLFEYLAAKRPILAIGPEKWDAGKIVTESEAGNYFCYSEKAAIKKFILSEFEKFQNGTNQIITSKIDKYHRRELTRDLADLIKSI